MVTRLMLALFFLFALTFVTGVYVIGVPREFEVSQQIAAWGVLVNLVSAIAAIGAGVAAFLNYLHIKIAAQVQETFERINAGFDRKISLLIETKELVGRLVSEPNLQSTSAKAGLTRFWSLYYADLIGVEGIGVEAAMVSLGEHFRELESNSQTREELGDLALILSDAVNKEIDVLNRKREKELKIIQGT